MWLALSLFLSQTSSLPACWRGEPTLDLAVQRAFEARAEFDSTPFTSAFHPIANAYWIERGEVSSLSHFGFRNALTSRNPLVHRDVYSVEWSDAGGDSALVRVATHGSGKPFIEHVLMTKTGGCWRSVAIVFAEAGQVGPDAAIRTLVEDKVLSDATWDSALLARTLHARALVFTVDEDEIVAASAAEWVARYVQRRRSPPGFHPTRHTIDRIDATPTTAAVRWSVSFSDGSTWTDRALLLKTNRGWKMIALAFSNQG
jgi:hypothetical protein